MATLYFAGAEQPSHRNLLVDCGVTRFAVNLSNLDNLAPGTAWSLPEHLPEGASWIAYADKDTWTKQDEIGDLIAQRLTTATSAEWIARMQPLKIWHAPVQGYAEIVADGVNGLKVVQLTVTEGNAAAQTLYEHCGFVSFGVEPFAVALGSIFLSKVHMWCPVGSLG